MRHRAIYAFLVIALLVPLPRALSAPVSAGSSPFIDVPVPGTVATVVQHHRLAVLRGLGVLTESPPYVTSAAPTVEAAPPGAAGPTESMAPVRGFLRPGDSRIPAATTTALVRPVPPRPGATIDHQVVAGDTLFALALRYGTTVDAIVAANGLASPDTLRLGQKLTVPPKGTASAVRRAVREAPARRAAAGDTPARRAPSVSYEVRNGDTLFAIARRYGTSISAIVAANNLPSAHRLQIGQRLVLPAGGAPRSAPTERRELRPASALRTVLSWPSRGMITSRYGWRWRRHHDGIDIASPHGTPIYAARAGRVSFAGWYYGYGRAVIIDHGGGLTTLYGHASSLLVRTGEVVERGDLIARVGCTGRCSGSHLHFEVRINGRAVNPLGYLR